ncbi:MAG TPA: bifunctional adenosylcobinamide kinase/adenosylcobinamide-phosphate guanylyltransferase [Actinomycetota bacterium]|nr:bifunctional adenosylcobinamide kinase/adenosylcobinamide-phosphate guanylyltransferase [Actinomycetota bacterium]
MSLSVLLGGARAGKSAIAVRLASTSGRPVVVVATAEARDEEMAERIRRHREDRPADWTTLEVPLGLSDAIGGLAGDACVILDCLSLWVSNEMEAEKEDDAIVEQARTVARTLAARDAPTIVVSNEVGLGIVPINDLARRYRDVLGRVNVAFVDAADAAYLVVAGRALPLEEPTFT